MASMAVMKSNDVPSTSKETDLLILSEGCFGSRIFNDGIYRFELAVRWTEKKCTDQRKRTSFEPLRECAFLCVSCVMGSRLYEELTARGSTVDEMFPIA
jgi:hypothetical protein